MDGSGWESWLGVGVWMCPGEWVSEFGEVSLSLSLSATSSQIPSLVIWFVASIACFRWMWHFHNCQKDRTCKTTKSLRSRPWTLVEGLEVRNLSRPGNCLSWGQVRDTMALCLFRVFGNQSKSGASAQSLFKRNALDATNKIYSTYSVGRTQTKCGPVMNATPFWDGIIAFGHQVPYSLQRRRVSTVFSDALPKLFLVRCQIMSNTGDLIVTTYMITIGL